MPVEYRVARSGELGALDALCQACIPVVEPGYFLARFAGDPTILPDGILVAVEEGRPVASVTAHGFAMRWGTSSFPCGGIANVVTDPAFRGRGHARALLGRAHALFAARGWPVSLLSAGIPEFYRPLGYEPVARDMLHVLSLSAPSATPDPAVRVRPVDWARDCNTLAAMHDAADAGLTGPLVRATATWDRCRDWTPRYPREDPGMALVAEEPAGRPAAYLRAATGTAPGWSSLLETAAWHGAERAVRELAAAWVRACLARGIRGIQVPAPCRGFADALKPFAAAATTVREETLMLRVPETASWLRAVLPHAELATLATATAALTALPPGPRIEVLMGVRLFSAQAFASRTRVAERDLVRLDTLLPRRDPVFWDADLF